MNDIKRLPGEPVADDSLPVGSLADNLRFKTYLEYWGYNQELEDGCQLCRHRGHPFTKACSA
jgi:hypothetical protein